MGWTNPEFALLSGCVVVRTDDTLRRRVWKIVQFDDGCRVYMLDHEEHWQFWDARTKAWALEFINTADELYIQAEDYR